MSEKFWSGKNQPLTSDKVSDNPEQAINDEGTNQSVPTTGKVTRTQPRQEQTQAERIQAYLDSHPNLDPKTQQMMKGKLEQTKQNNAQNQDFAASRPELNGDYGQASNSETSQRKQSDTSEVDDNSISNKENLGFKDELLAQVTKENNQNNTRNEKLKLAGEYGQGSDFVSKPEQSETSDLVNSGSNDRGNNI